MNLSKNTKLTRVINAQAVGTTTVNGSVVDMQNFEGVMFAVAMGAVTDAASIKLQQGVQSDGSDMTDLEGTSVTVPADGDNQIFWLDIYRPRERYVRVVVVRGGATGAVIDAGLAVQYGPRKAPTTHDSTTVGDGELHASPAEGTA